MMWTRAATWSQARYIELLTRQGTPQHSVRQQDTRRLPSPAPYAFAPPLPTDEEIAAMSAAEFDAEIDTWTDTAKAAAD